MELLLKPVVRAVQAFVSTLVSPSPCEHRRVNLMQTPCYCHDCGYAVTIEWHMLHCRRCNNKRIPHKNFLGEVKPLHAYCRHCGYEGTRLVKKERIEAYELMYAIPEKGILFQDPADPLARPVQGPAVTNPFQAGAFNTAPEDIIDAEVVSRETTQKPYASRSQQNKSTVNAHAFSYKSTNARQYQAPSACTALIRPQAPLS